MIHEHLASLIALSDLSEVDLAHVTHERVKVADVHRVINHEPRSRSLDEAGVLQVTNHELRSPSHVAVDGLQVTSLSEASHVTSPSEADLATHHEKSLRRVDALTRKIVMVPSHHEIRREMDLNQVESLVDLRREEIASQVGSPVVPRRDVIVSLQEVARVVVMRKEIGETPLVVNLTHVVAVRSVAHLSRHQNRHRSRSE